MSCLRCFLVLLSFSLIVACSTDNPEPEPIQPEPIVEQLNPVAIGQLVPNPPGPDEGIRNRRRMDLDQLEAAINTATGGLYWGATTNDRMFEELAQTLGKPDYLDTTDEDLEPSMLFQKFLGDAARDVCQQRADRDLVAEEEERLLLVHVAPEDTIESNPEGVETNLRYLLFRYHSTQLEAGSPLLNPWAWLFESSVHVTNDPVAAWRTVCVGLITHPSFYSY